MTQGEKHRQAMQQNDTGHTVRLAKHSKVLSSAVADGYAGPFLNTWVLKVIKASGSVSLCSHQTGGGSALEDVTPNHGPAST